MTEENQTPETEGTETAPETQGEAVEETTDQQGSEEQAPEPEVAKTESGVVINDPQRAQKKLADWETAELTAYLKGELENVPKNLQSGIVKEYRRRVELPEAWSEQEVLNYFRQDILPEKTESGLWVNDVTRANRAPADWSNEELEAWVHNEIKPVGKANAGKLAHEVVNRFELSASPNDINKVRAEFDHKFAQETEDDESTEQATPEPAKPTAPKVAEPVGALTAMNVSFIDTTLENYVRAVSPNAQVGEEEGGKAQRSLESLFQYVLRLEGKALKDGLNRVNAFINKHRDGVFSPSNAYRFVHHLKGNPKHQVQHVNMIELFLMTGDANQARRQQVDMRHMLKDLPNAKIEILVDYFKNHAKV